jgi:hypothetical protein
MRNPPPAAVPRPYAADKARTLLRRLYARHFATVQRLEARRLAAANRRIARS